MDKLPITSQEFGPTKNRKFDDEKKAIFHMVFATKNTCTLLNQKYSSLLK